MTAPRMRLSSARLAALFVVIFAAAITLVLTAVYVLTARVLDREVDSVIRSEVTHLVDDYSSGGLLQLVATLRRRADSWDRTGAVYLLIEPNGYPIAGNLAHWPYEFDTYGNWIEFEIDASESGGVVSHPVRAQVFLLPGSRRLLVGTDILERRKLATRLRTAMFWGAGSSVLLATIFGFSYSRRIRRRVRVNAPALLVPGQRGLRRGEGLLDFTDAEAERCQVRGRLRAGHVGRELLVHPLQDT